MTGHEQQSRREGRKEPDNVGLFRVDKETSAGWGRLRDDLDFHVNYICYGLNFADQKLLSVQLKSVYCEELR